VGRYVLEKGQTEREKLLRRGWFDAFLFKILEQKEKHERDGPTALQKDGATQLTSTSITSAFIALPKRKRYCIKAANSDMFRMRSSNGLLGWTVGSSSSTTSSLRVRFRDGMANQDQKLVSMIFQRSTRDG
jgi:hypothetical protein